MYDLWCKLLLIGIQTVPLVIKYELTSDSNHNGVNITCFFLDESTTDCVVIVHRVNSALISSGVMNISSHVFTRSESGDSASGYIKGVNLQEYHFGVIGGELREDDVHTNGILVTLYVNVDCCIASNIFYCFSCKEWCFSIHSNWNDSYSCHPFIAGFDCDICIETQKETTVRYLK